MTCEEFSREFDILYNNITSNQAPGLNDYEKSVFLTQAQESIILEMYSEKFEDTEDVTSYLNALVRRSSINLENAGISPALDEYRDKCSQKYIYEIAFDSPDYDHIWFILFEEAIKGKTEIPVIPTTWDELHRTKRNPFRNANNHRVLRVEVGEDDGDRVSILLSNSILNKYNFTFLQRPEPIVISNLYENDYGDLMTIDSDFKDLEEKDSGGNTYIKKNECKLNPAIHRSILSRAVQIAKSSWTSN